MKKQWVILMALVFGLSLLAGIAVSSVYEARYEEANKPSTRAIYKVLLYCGCTKAFMEVSQDRPWIFNYTCIHCNQKVLYRRITEKELDMHYPKRRM